MIYSELYGYKTKLTKAQLSHSLLRQSCPKRRAELLRTTAVRAGTQDNKTDRPSNRDRSKRRLAQRKTPLSQQ